MTKLSRLIVLVVRYHSLWVVHGVGYPENTALQHPLVTDAVAVQFAALSWRNGGKKHYKCTWKTVNTAVYNLCDIYVNGHVL